ncbi:nitroreductase family deazaflavin-dependent oxidoreductase [Mycolicibacterium sp.]|uniref:nitroreductase family deazaflavin-dependent oxidoreductase n=1 Tax=Mycolicibacterium TaxID=1866885 RepID=UPI0037CBF0DE
MANATTSPLMNKIRIFNKYVLNPLMLQLAGRKHWYASVIHHTGRHTGKRYATPVVAERIADGFLVPLPYGTTVDWLRNLRAAGRATITVSGHTHEVDQPQVIEAATAAPLLSARRRRTYARFGVAHYLKVTLADQQSGHTPRHTACTAVPTAAATGITASATANTSANTSTSSRSAARTRGLAPTARTSQNRPGPHV